MQQQTASTDESCAQPAQSSILRVIVNSACAKEVSVGLARQTKLRDIGIKRAVVFKVNAVSTPTAIAGHRSCQQRRRSIDSSKQASTVSDMGLIYTCVITHKSNKEHMYKQR